MTAFVTVAAVRIQSWLVRTPRLALLRGASAALSHETATPQIEAALQQLGLAPGVELAREAGDVAGVVVVSVPPPMSPSEVARTLADYLRRTLPGVEWEAWWAEAASYLEACVKHDERTDTDDGFTVLPHLLDGTIATSCPSCRREPAGSEPIHQPGGTKERLGPDCRVRNDHTANAGASLRLPGRAPSDFSHLAREGGLPAKPEPTRPGAVGRRDSRNHLATIAADGNRIGELFKTIRVASDVQLQTRAVTALDTATKTATYRALLTLADNPPVAAGIRHYVGGDDILVTVPAPLAWEFCGHLGVAFEQTFGDAMRDSQRRDGHGTTLPHNVEQVLGEASIGIGVVFAHASHPFADAQALAHKTMTQAKKLVRGRSCALSWVDLTCESAAPSQRVLALTRLRVDLGLDGPTEAAAAARTRRWRALVSLSPSARATLTDLLNEWGGGTDERAVTEALSTVFQWARRTDHEDLLPMPDGAGAGPGTPRLADLAAAARLEALVELRDGLSRARWWPGRPTPSTELFVAGGRA